MAKNVEIYLKMAIKNLLNEEQYKKLEKYIIKLQDISDKLQRKSDSADVA